MNLLQKGQSFSFATAQAAIMVFSPVGGGGAIGFHVPATWYKENYNPFLLKEERSIAEDEIFVVEDCWSALGGWSVDAVSQTDGTIIRFSQWRPATPGELHPPQKHDPKFIEVQLC